MTLKSKIITLNERAAKLSREIRELNIDASELNGVAATMPEAMPYPASYFSGQKVILHNVAFDPLAGHLRATVSIPYVEDDTKERKFSGGNYRFCLGEKWFKERLKGVDQDAKN